MGLLYHSQLYIVKEIAKNLQLERTPFPVIRYRARIQRAQTERLCSKNIVLRKAVNLDFYQKI